MKRAIVVAANVVVFCVAAEMLGLILYYYGHGWLFYAHERPRIPVIAEADQQRLSGEALHPYFGPTHKSGVPFDVPAALQVAPRFRARTNNYGFVSVHDYPFARQHGDQFLLGVFGGSVGVWFCEVGVHRLVEDLTRDARFAGKEVVPLCFAHEGYKQPQQFLVLSYFLSIGQPFDAVINIDGFNEVALGTVNDARGLEFSMPSAHHLEPLINVADPATLTPVKIASLARIQRAKEQLNDFARRINGARLAATHFIFAQAYEYIERRYERETVTFANLPSNPPDNSVIQVTGKRQALDSAGLLDAIAENWMAASTGMRDLLAARGVPYYHLLQPNQYYGSRRFSPDEARVALSGTSPYRASIPHGYERLRARAAETGLAAREAFIDGTHLFDSASASVYMDNCCHYTLLGNQLLADALAARMLKDGGVWTDTRGERP